MKSILFVDLDESLISTDILREQLIRSFAVSPWKTLKILIQQGFRPERVKAAIAAQIETDPKTLPYNEKVLALIHQAKKEGRRVVLATATHEKVARQIAHHLGCFDAILATTDTFNCKGKNKLAQMKEFAKGTSFDYVGDSRADVAIFNEAHIPYIVGGLAYPKAHQRIPRPLIVKPFLVAIRPHLWAKNGLIFLPLLASLPLTWALVCTGAIGFFCFSLTASVAYIIHGMVGAELDRHHPLNKNRPFAKGALTVDEGLWASLLLLGPTVLISLFWFPKGLWVLGGYGALAVFYELSLKGPPIFPLFFLSALYGIRVLYGQVIFAIDASSWVLAFWAFIFIILALKKGISRLRRKGL